MENRQSGFRVGGLGRAGAGATIMAIGLSVAALVAAPAARAQSPGEVSITLEYSGEVLTGAGRAGPDYVDNLDIIGDWDDGNTRVHAYVLYNNGRDFSGPRFPRGYVASNLETGVRAVRLYEAWVEHRLADGRLSLLGGLYDYNSEFDVLEASGLFLNPVHGIGNDIGQTGLNGPSIFPSTSLAFRVAVRPSDALTIRAAVLDGVPGDPARPRRTAVKLGRGDGAMVAIEADQRVGAWRFLAGGWRYTAAFDDMLATAQAGRSVAREGNHGVYLRGEGLLAGQAEGRGTDAFFRVGWANGRFNALDRLATAGLRFRAPLPSRPGDQAGIAFAWSGSAGRARAAGALNGDPATRNEWSVEATYSLQLTDWIAVQPDVQYIANPAFEPDRDAWVGGVRLTLSWSNKP